MEFTSKGKKYVVLEVFPEYVLGEGIDDGLVELIPYYDIDSHYYDGSEETDGEPLTNIISLGYYKWLRKKKHNQ